MTKNSIIVKITILFAVALLSLSAFSFYFIKMQIDKESSESQRKYGQFIATINQIMRYGGNVELIEKYLAELEFHIVNDDQIKENLSKQIDPHFKGVIAKIVRDNESIYLLLQTPERVTLYRDSFKTVFKNYYLLTFIAFFIVVFLYVLVIKSLLPLKSLRKEIRKFAEGRTDIHCALEQNDEIGELANEFDNAVKKIAALNESRHLFLRTIMHELKTPLTKGRIVAEMIDNPKQKERLCSVFHRLNGLIDEFAKIEEMSSKNYQVSKNEYRLHAILHHVLKKLMIESEQAPTLLDLPTQEVIVKADFELLSLAIKNLLDNALKYSHGGKIFLEAKGDSLNVKNFGAPLPYPIEEYFKPFFKDAKNPHSQGLGLGLYIAKSTLEAQGFPLLYQYEEGMHQFTLKGVVVEK
ncbi:ArsS family sensor histidine kinase [Wolinella succinogenes]|uniref:ArsS family sensor histidine kinase n=1 Tax=Wolinella succinogenes TaxID=844 RepID=UPI00240A0835|nr:ArsS family sensor histidine kinase [Wolinella succinogenes]